MFYALIGALIVGLALGAFGSGGSILTVPVLIYLLHHDDKVAIAESLAIVGLIATASSIPYIRQRLVEWRTALLFGIPGMAGTYAGAWVAGFVPGYVQLFVFSGVMFVAAWQMWTRNPTASPDPSAEGSDATFGATKQSTVKIGGEGLGVGVLTGFVGVGGGFLIVPALVLLGGLTMRRAVATSLVIIAMKSAAGFPKYLDVLGAAGGSVNWATIAVFVVFGSVGSFAGKRLNAKINQGVLQRAFAVFLVLMAGFIAVTEGVRLTSPHSPDPETKEVLHQ